MREYSINHMCQYAAPTRKKSGGGWSKMGEPAIYICKKDDSSCYDPFQEACPKLDISCQYRTTVIEQTVWSSMKNLDYCGLDDQLCNKSSQEACPKLEGIVV